MKYLPKISYFDIYGSLFNFTINKELKFKTFVGGLITIITSVFAIYISFEFGKNFFFKTNPIILLNKEIIDDFEIIKTSNSNYTIAIRIEDHLGNIIPKINSLKPFVAFFKKFKNEKTKQISEKIFPIQMKNCSKENFYEKSLENFYEKSQEKWICLEISDYMISLWENLDSFLTNEIKIYVNSCELDVDKKFTFEQILDNNFTESNKIVEKNCQKIQTLELFDTNEIFFSTIYPEVNYKLLDLDNPFRILYKKNSIKLSKNTKKTEKFILHSKTLIDDESWFFISEKQSKSFSIDSVQRDFDFIENDEGKNVKFYEGIYILDEKYSLCKRSFMKFQDFLAIIGGFLKLLQIFIYITYSGYNKFSREKYLINFLYDDGKNIVDTGKLSSSISNRDHLDRIYDLKALSNLKKKPSRNYILDPRLSKDLSPKRSQKNFNPEESENHRKFINIGNNIDKNDISDTNQKSTTHLKPNYFNFKFNQSNIKDSFKSSNVEKEVKIIQEGDYKNPLNNNNELEGSINFKKNNFIENKEPKIFQNRKKSFKRGITVNNTSRKTNNFLEINNENFRIKQSVYANNYNSQSENFYSGKKNNKKNLDYDNSNELFTNDFEIGLKRRRNFSMLKQKIPELSDEEKENENSKVNEKINNEENNEINNENNDNNNVDKIENSLNNENIIEKNDVRNIAKSFKLEYSSSRLKKNNNRRLKMLKMNFFDYCWTKFCKKNINRDKEGQIFIFDKARNFISKKLDLFKYLKNLQNMNIVIDLLTNENQKTALKYLSMPCLNTENFDIVKRDKILGQNLETHNKMIDYFKEKKRYENMTEIDLKILELLNNRFSKI